MLVNGILAFFDMEFTGLTKNSTQISIGITTQGGKKFYAEFTDYDRSQVDNWIEENVISKLWINNGATEETTPDYYVCGDKDFIRSKLIEFFAGFNCKVTMVSDCLAYDWVLFNDIFGSAFDIPKNVYYIPYDICTLFAEKNIDPDIEREKFAGITDGKKKHNALFDAEVIQKCYDKLISM